MVLCAGCDTMTVGGQTDSQAARRKKNEPHLACLRRIRVSAVPSVGTSGVSSVALCPSASLSTRKRGNWWHIPLIDLPRYVAISKLSANISAEGAFARFRSRETCTTNQPIHK